MLQKYVAASVALGVRKGGLSALSERLLTFMFTQTSTVGGEEEGEGEEEKEPAEDHEEAERNETAGGMLR